MTDLEVKINPTFYKKVHRMMENFLTFDEMLPTFVNLRSLSINGDYVLEEGFNVLALLEMKDLEAL